jgi:hypothetical protein
MRDLCDSENDIILHAIVVKKEHVLLHIGQDANKLYNYMIRLALLAKMAKHDVVTMVPDPRTIKVRAEIACTTICKQNCGSLQNPVPTS